ncbi:hypothetical protein GW742_10055 [Citrobacter freundii]|nr:hypothetical protein [Citrobacter freundii]MBC6506687.1 hypothetical protein [Citrobacter freundii]
MKHDVCFLIILCATALSGCTYTPRQVEASRPLVKEAAYAGYQPVPAALDTLPPGATLRVGGHISILGERYLSALGQPCTELLRHENDNPPQRRVACKSGETWYLIPPLEQVSARTPQVPAQ